MRKILAAVFLLLSACTTKVSYLSVVVPEGQQFNSYTLAQATVRKNVKAEDTNVAVLFFPIGMPKMQTALKKALVEGNGNVMTNVTVVEKMRWYVLFGWNTIELFGDVVRVREPQRGERVL